MTQSPTQLKNVAALGALAATLIANPLQAQDQKLPTMPSANPAAEQHVVMSSEVDAREDQISGRKGVPFIQGQVDYGSWVARYHIKTNLVRGETLANVGGVFNSNVLATQDTKVGAGILAVGNNARTNEYWGLAYVQTQVRNLPIVDSVTIRTDLGASSVVNGTRRFSNITKISHPHFTLEEGTLSQDGFFHKTDLFWWAAAHTEHMYAAAGRCAATPDQDKAAWRAFAGVHGFKDFGTFNFWQYNPNTGEFWFKSQTGVGSANQQFYSLSNFNDATSYLTLTPQYQKHFSPIVTKGSNTIKIEAKGGRKSMTLEAMFGKKTDIIDVGAGVLATWKGDVQSAEPVLELYKGFDFGNFKGYLEGRYVKNNAGLYIQGQYTL
jgi:hypothetical protein